MNTTASVNRLLYSIIASSGVSQQELSKKTGISHTTLNRFLNGKSSLNSEYLFSLFEALGIDVASLLQSKLEQTVGLKTSISDTDSLDHILNIIPFKNRKKTVLKNVLASINEYKDVSSQAQNVFDSIEKRLKSL